MADKKQAGASRRQGTFETPGGQSYLDNLRYVFPDAEVDEMVKRVEDADKKRAKKQ